MNPDYCLPLKGQMVRFLGQALDPSFAMSDLADSIDLVFDVISYDLPKPTWEGRFAVRVVGVVNLRPRCEILGEVEVRHYQRVPRPW